MRAMGLKTPTTAVLKTLDKAAVSYQVVLTKADQVKAADSRARGRDRGGAAKQPAAFPEVMTTSSRDGRRHAGAARRYRAARRRAQRLAM